MLDHDLKIIQCSVRVEGIVGHGVALVNQGFVKAGDSVNGVSVMEVADKAGDTMADTITDMEQLVDASQQ